MSTFFGSYTAVLALDSDRRRSFLNSPDDKLEEKMKEAELELPDTAKKVLRDALILICDVLENLEAPVENKPPAVPVFPNPPP